MKVEFKETVTVDNVDLWYIKHLVTKMYKEAEELWEEKELTIIDERDDEEYYIRLNPIDWEVSSYINLFDLHIRWDRSLNQILNIIDNDPLFHN